MTRSTFCLFLALAACSAPAPFSNELEVKVQTEGGFVPWAEGLPVKFTVSGKVANALPGSLVPLRVGLASQTSADSVRIINIVPEPTDGGFLETVSLNAPAPGEGTVFAELAARSFSQPFVIATGKLGQSYFERSGTDAFVGCVDLGGEAAELVLEVDGVDEKPPRDARACDGTAGKSVGISVPSTTTRWRLKEKSDRLPAIDLTGPTAPRTLTLLEPVEADGGTAMLPIAGAPVVVRFRLAGDSPLAFTAWRAVAAPQGETGIFETSGVTDASGMGSVLLISPLVGPLVVRIQSGRLEEHRTFSR